jgi:hypothetical protein
LTNGSGPDFFVDSELFLLSRLAPPGSSSLAGNLLTPLFKTAARRPSRVSPDHAFQLATYQQITPGTSGAVRIDSLVKTQTVQIVQQAYAVGKPDVRATQVLYPMARKAMESGMYCPNRQSMLCSQKHCSFWKHCEDEFGGRVRPS